MASGMEGAITADLTEYRRALVPLDGSPAAEAVLPGFLRFARGLGLEVVLVRVVPPVRPLATQASETAIRTVMDQGRRLQDEAQAYLGEVADRLAASGLRVTTETRVGDPATEILAAARDFHADVIALASRGRGAMARLLFGSVAQDILRRSPIPVFVLRPPARPPVRRAA